jgi:hypothetical protein
MDDDQIQLGHRGDGNEQAPTALAAEGVVINRQALEPVDAELMLLT